MISAIDWTWKTDEERAQEREEQREGFDAWLRLRAPCRETECILLEDPASLASFPLLLRPAPSRRQRRRDRLARLRS